MSRFKAVVKFLDGFRKLSIIAATLFIITLLLLWDYLNAEWYAKILMAALPAYFAANVGEHISDRVGEWIKSMRK